VVPLGWRLVPDTPPQPRQRRAAHSVVTTLVCALLTLLTLWLPWARVSDDEQHSDVLSGWIVYSDQTCFTCPLHVLDTWALLLAAACALVMLFAVLYLAIGEPKLVTALMWAAITALLLTLATGIAVTVDAVHHGHLASDEFTHVTGRVQFGPFAAFAIACTGAIFGHKSHDQA
jgi:hypothetical protein